MVESSVRLKLSVELDKSSFKEQVLDLQKELEDYRLKIGVEPVTLDRLAVAESGSDSSQVTPKTFENQEAPGLDFTEFSGTVRAILDYAITLQNVAESIKQEVGEVRKVLVSTVQRLGRDDTPSDRQSTFLPRGDSSGNEKPSGLLGWLQNKMSSVFSTSEPAEVSTEVLLKISELQKSLDDANLVLEDIADYVKPDDSAINLVNERARIERIQGTNLNAPNAILPKVSQDPVDLNVGAVAPTATVQLEDVIPNQSSNFDAECCDQITGSIELLTDVVNDILSEVVRINRDQTQAQTLVTNQNQNISTITNQVSHQTTTNNQAAAPLSPRILDPNSDAGDKKSGNLFDSIAGAFDQIDFGNSLFPIVEVIANLAEPLVNLVGAIAPLGGMLLNAFTTFAPIQARFNTIGGSQEAGQEFFDYVLNFVDKTAQPLMPAIDGYSRLIASAQGTRLEGADTNTLFEGVSKAVAALGLSGEDAQGIFLALSQIISNGKVQAEELRGQIGERLPGTMQLFAESLGMSVAELNKAMEQGELVATTVLPKFGELLNEKFGDAANEASRNFVGSLNRIQTSLTKLQISFVETFGGFANNVAFTVSSVLNPILQLFDQLVLKSGLFYNILLGAQAVAVIGITKVLTNFKVGELLLKGIAATYSKIGVVLVPFAYAVAQQLISIGVSKWLGIEIESSVALIVKAYRNLADSLEPLLTTISQIPGATIKAVSNAFSSLREGIANTFNSARLVTNRFVGGLKNIVTNLNLVTSRVKATSRELGNFTSIMVNPSPRESQGSNLGEIVNIPSLAKVTLELSGLFLLVAQGGLAFVALGKYIKSVVVNFVSMTATALKAAFSFGVLNKTAGATTATFGALAVALTGIAALLILVAARSKFRFTFEDDIGKLESTLVETQETLARLDGSTATINFKAQGLEEIAATTRKSFANLGFNLTFWRDINSGDAFTSDDLIRLFNDRKNINRNQVSGGLISSRMLPVEPERAQSLLDAVTNQLTSTDVPLEDFNKFLDDRTLGGLANLEASLTKKLEDVEAELAATRKLQNPLNSFAEITKLNRKVSELTKEAKSLTTVLGKIEESRFATANDNFLLNLEDATTQLAAAPKNLFQQIPIIGSIIPNATTAAFDLGQLQNQIAPSIEVIRETARAQNNPDISNRLISTLQEGSATDLRVLLESIDFSGNRPTINGLQFDGTAQELERFKRAVEFATRGLTSIEKVATNTSGNTAKILRGTIGIGGGNSEVTEAIAQINRAFFDLEQSGAISNQELKTLTSPGTIGNVEQRLTDFLTQNLDTRVSSAPVANQDEVAQSIEVLREQQKVLEQLGETNNFADILTEEERQLINLQGAVSDFLATVEQSRNTLGTKEFQKANTNIKAFANLIGDTRPVLSANIQKLLELETQLDSLAAERLQVQDRLKSPELSSGERSDLGKRERELGDRIRALQLQKETEALDLKTQQDNLEAAQKFAESLKQNVLSSVELDYQTKKSIVDQINKGLGELSTVMEQLESMSSIVDSSAEEKVASAAKSINQIFSNLEKSTQLIEAKSSLALADISKTNRERGLNLPLLPDVVTSAESLGLSPTVLDLQNQSLVTQEEFNTSQALLDNAREALSKIQAEFREAELAQATAPTPTEETLAPLREKLAQAEQAFSEAESNYNDKFFAYEQNKLDMIRETSQAQIKQAEFNKSLQDITNQRAFLTGEIVQEQLDALSLESEKLQIEVELKANEDSFREIQKAIEDGTVTSVALANQELSNLQTNRLDIELRQLENLQAISDRNQEIELRNLTNQTDLANKYFDVSIAGYEKLNTQAQGYLKQLDLIQNAGDAIASFNQATIQSQIGNLTLGSDIVTAIASARESIQNSDTLPSQRDLDARRLAGLEQIARGQGIGGNLFDESGIAATQQKIAKEIADTKIAALKEEQALASKLLQLEIKRNQINAQVAVREAQINKLKAEQAVLQARANLQRAMIETQDSQDKTAVTLAQMDLQIAQLGLDGAVESLDFTEQNNAIQQALNEIKQQQLKTDQRGAVDTLTGELINNPNLDLSQITGKLSNLRRFNTEKVSSQEVFGDVFQNLESQKVKADLGDVNYSGNLAQDLQALSEATERMVNEQGKLDATVNTNLIAAQNSLMNLTGSDTQQNFRDLKAGDRTTLGFEDNPEDIGFQSLENLDFSSPTLKNGATESNQLLTNVFLSEILRAVKEVAGKLNITQGISEPILPAPESLQLPIKEDSGKNPIPVGSDLRLIQADLQSQLPQIPIPNFNKPEKNATAPNNFFNPTFQPNLGVNLSSPSVNVTNKQQSMPLYYLNSIANQISPTTEMTYRIPPGLQRDGGPTNFAPPTINNTINIVNKIDANSQRELYTKIGEVQGKTIVESLKSILS